MKSKSILLLVTVLSVRLAVPLLAAPLGTAFTYQGRLNDGGSLATGNYDLLFTLTDALTNGNPVGTSLTNASVAVSNGLFTVTLDFGSAAFDGSARWIEVGVRTNGSGGDFVALAPRQVVTAVPYALTATTLTGAIPPALLTSVPAASLTGTISPVQLSGDVALLTASQTFFEANTFINPANVFTGSGSGLTGLAAGSLVGTVADAQLSPNIPRLNGNAVFTGAVQFNNATGSFNGLFSGNGASLANVNLMAASSAGALSWRTNYGSSFMISALTAVGSGPTALTAADVNGDGKMDVISANYTANTLTVLTNDGHGRLVLASAPATGTGPFALTAADVNGDGKIDLISANAVANTLTVLTNDGNSGFVLASSPAVAGQPTSVAAADVNGDGKMDLISANFGDNTLTVLTNDGSAGFFLASSPDVQNSPHAVVAADVNGDGKMDLIGADLNDNRVKVLTNDGSGGFVLASSPHVGSSPYALAAADVNGDGKIDLISANTGDHSLTILTNDGSGGLVFASSAPVGNLPYSITTADVNGDGKMDLVAANFGDNTLTVLTNSGNGGFAIAATVGVGRSPYGVTAADIDGDGRADAISISYSDNSLTVLVNTPLFQANFSGSGAGLTGLNGTNLTGTVADARLSANVALLGGSQTFSGRQTFSGTGVALSLQNPGSHNWDISVNGAGNLLFTDTTSGNFTFFRSIDGTVGSGSDLKLKKDISPLGQTLDRVLKLRPVSYRFKTSPDQAAKTIGFIAQEVERLFPEVVVENGAYKGLAYSEMIPVAIGAIQELHEAMNQKDAEIKSLKAKAAQAESLEKRIEALERLLLHPDQR